MEVELAASSEVASPVRDTPLVYFWQPEERPDEIKIGKTTLSGVGKRWQDLSAMGPLVCRAILAVPSGSTEKDFFRAFSAYHIERERYQFVGKLAAYVEMVASKPFCATEVGNADAAYPAPSMYPWHQEDDAEDSEPETLALFDVGPAPRRSIPESLSDDWQTAPLYLALARDAMQVEQFDLDPASNPDYNRVVGARAIFTQHDGPNGGLDHPWKADSLWMNPPFGGQAGDWVAKLLHEYEVGNVKQAIWTLPTRTTTNIWFDPLWEHPLCITNHRAFFKHPDGTWGSSPGGHVFGYLGALNASRFVEKFRLLGATTFSMNPPMQPDRRWLRNNTGWRGSS